MSRGTQRKWDVAAMLSEAALAAHGQRLMCNGTQRTPPRALIPGSTPPDNTVKKPPYTAKSHTESHK